MKRLRSTETLDSTSAVNSGKTGTLTLNQMTAVELTIPGRRYSIDGNGYSTVGTIKRSAGQPDVDLEQFMQPPVLACDAVVHDGELIGDPTEEALVVLGEKWGLDAGHDTRDVPTGPELPFDAAYKLTATLHRMKDESGHDGVRCFVKRAPDQHLARATTTLAPDDLSPVADEDALRKRYEAENRRLGERGLRVLATARKAFDPATFDAKADLLPLLDGLTLLAPVGIVDPTASDGEGRDRGPTSARATAARRRGARARASTPG
jgi:Ca2+-transporting ATPase